MKSNNDKIPDPFETSPLTQSAIQMHELYTEFRSAGFSRYEALTIICHIATSGMKED